MGYEAKPLQDRETQRADSALKRLATMQESLAFEESIASPRNVEKRDKLEQAIFKAERDARRWRAGEYGHKIVKSDTGALERAQANLAESSKGMAERLGLPFLRDKFLKILKREEFEVNALEWDGETLSIWIDDSKVDALEWSGLEARQAFKVIEPEGVEAMEAEIEASCT